MGTTSTKLNYLLETKEALKNALAAKGVSVSSSDTFRSYADKIKSISGHTIPNDVNLYDYDGTCVYSYSANDFLNLTELPPCPKYARFEGSNWNWGLSDAKEFVRQNGILDIGALHSLPYNITARFYLSIRFKTQLNVALALRFSSDGSQIDWGDGSSLESLGSGKQTYQHEYQSVGDYCITIKGYYNTLLPDDPIFGQSEESPNTTLTDLELGDVRLLGEAFANCYQLRSIVTSGKFETANGTFRPFQNNPNLKAIISPNKSYGYDIVGYGTFCNCKSLAVCAVGRWEHLKQGQSFSGCSSLRRLTFVKTDSYERMGGSLFKGCSALSELIIPSNTYNIGTSDFADCISLQQLKIPASVSVIEGTSFSGCICLRILDFREHTSIPTIYDNSLTGIPTDCKIVVPDALYDEWIAAANWSSYASQIIKASEYNG